MAPRREDLGSWLEGTPGGGPDGPRSENDVPEDGRAPVATLGRRTVALAVDWLASMAVASLVWREPGGVGPFAAQPWATLAVFAVSTAVLVSFLGATIGHRLLGLRVVPVASRDGEPVPDGQGHAVPGPRAGVVRTALLCLVIPAVVWDRSGRGLHDVTARTVVVRG